MNVWPEFTVTVGVQEIAVDTSVVVLPAVRVVVGRVTVQVEPPADRVAEVTVVLAVPVLIRTTDALPAARAWAIEVCELIWTLAFAAALPNMPNMYPSTAAKAMSVAAMMRTVATIGEIAFLRCPDIFIASTSLRRILTVRESDYGCRIHMSEKGRPYHALLAGS